MGDIRLTRHERAGRRAGHSRPQSGDICISMIGVCCISTLSVYLHPNLQHSHNDSRGVDIMVNLMMELW